MKIFLLGVKHAGKTTVGKFLAQISGFSFFDLDKEIEDRNGTSVRDLYKNMGKSLFMKEEAIECSIISQDTGNSVVSTGGGISDNGEALKIIKDCGVSVFLDIPFDAVWQRIAEKAEKTGSLPGFLSPDNPKEQFREIYDRRRKIYLDFSDYVFSIQEKDCPPDSKTIAEKLYNMLIKKNPPEIQEE